MNRLQRFTDLRTKKHLVYGEAMIFSRTDTTGIEYFHQMMRDRQKVYKDWQKWSKRYPNISPTRKAWRYHKMIRDWYAGHGWVKGGKIDPWQAWRAYEKRWKDTPKGAQYLKPAKKKTRLMSQVQRKIEKSLGF